MDGTQIEAWASIKSFRAVDEEPPGEDGDGDGAAGGVRNATRDFHGARWSNETHRSTTDDDCRLYRKGKGKEAKLSYMGHVLMENRDGLVVDGLASPGCHWQGRDRSGGIRRVEDLRASWARHG